ncbi:hypothetical protein KSI01_11150 [Kurthia sibirica]|nr:hypothetical protein KSI01_11150 [Kurthia sibirica]
MFLSCMINFFCIRMKEAYEIIDEARKIKFNYRDNYNTCIQPQVMPLSPYAKECSIIT